ncbi:hypothetical protein [Paenibacillus koleovorans]|uniref:hypothetical protein n=1 Tax=Paenibacillus koleovorans TaxID=121608 RepID=UPI000FDBE8F9|nr:hypothetical protein [Paenibacillus koleovorans]
MSNGFVYDERLGIELPALDREWEQYSETERAEMLERWERIRGAIPDRIQALERIIIRKQLQLDVEDDFPTSCRLNYEIAEKASCITDLHLWYRVNQELSTRAHH